MKRQIIFSQVAVLLFILNYSAACQVVNKGKIISVSKGSKVSIPTDVVNEGAIKNDGSIFLSGDWSNLNTYLSTQGKFVLAGTGNQTIDNNRQSFSTLEVAGNGEKIFLSDVFVNDSLNLISGILKIDDKRYLLTRESALITGGSQNSYVDGYLYREGLQQQFYPVGSDGTYNPAYISEIEGSAPVIGMRAANLVEIPVQQEGELDQIVYNRYWERKILSGTLTAATMELGYATGNLQNSTGISSDDLIIGMADSLDGAFTDLGNQNSTERDGYVYVKSEIKGSGGNAVYTFGRKLNTGRVKDSIALVTLFETLNGTEWIRNNNWTKEGTRLEDWEGVTVNNETGRVSGLVLNENNLSGEIPSKIKYLDEMTDLDLSGNQLEGKIPVQIKKLKSLETCNLSGNMLTEVPKLTAMKSLANLDVSDNQLMFSSLEENLELDNFVFMPQDSVGLGGNIVYKSGVSPTLSVPKDSRFVTYQWYYKNIPIEGEYGNSLKINKLSRSNMGQYRCEATSSRIADFKMYGRTNNILATAEVSGTVTTAQGDFVRGSVALLKVRNGAYDTTAVQPILPGGVFSFNQAVLGDYLIVAIPSDDDLYIPTYYRRAIQWDFAEKINLTSDRHDLDIVMEEVPTENSSGDGAVLGTVFSILDENARVEARRRVRRVGVALRRRRSNGREDRKNDYENFDLIAYTQTDDNGMFSFRQLPDGVYRIYIEYPGIPIDPESFTQFELGENMDENELELSATVFEDKIVIDLVKATGIPREYVEEMTMYPNPVTDEAFFIKIKANNTYELIVDLIDSRGSVISTKKLNSTQGQLTDGVFKIETGHLTPGVYMVRTSTPGLLKEEQDVRRIIVK